MLFEGLKGKKYDHTLKWMAEQEPQGFFAWLMEILDKKQFALKESLLSKELAPAPRQVDLVWRIVSPAGTEALLQIELQLEPEEDMARRMVEYGMRLFERDHLPVLSVIIFLRRTSSIPTSPFVLALNGEELFLYHYFVIRLWEVPQGRILEQPYPVLWPLAGLMANTTAESIATVGQQIATAQELSRPLKAELIGYLGLLAGIQLEITEVRAALRRHPLVNELWQHSSIAQDLKEEGRVEGLAEGQAEGRLEAARDLARLALEGRFGSLSEDLLAALQGVDEATARELIQSITRTTLEQVRARLGLPTTPA